MSIEQEVQLHEGIEINTKHERRFRIPKKYKKITVGIAVFLELAAYYTDGPYNEEYRKFGDNCSTVLGYVPPDSADFSFDLAQEFKPEFVFDKTIPEPMDNFIMLFEVNPDPAVEHGWILTTALFAEQDGGVKLFGGTVGHEEIGFRSVSLSRHAMGLLHTVRKVFKPLKVMDGHRGDVITTRVYIYETTDADGNPAFGIRGGRMQRHNQEPWYAASNLSCDGTRMVVQISGSKQAPFANQKECNTNVGNNDLEGLPFFSEHCRGNTITSFDLSPSDNIGTNTNRKDPLADKEEYAKQFPNEHTWDHEFCGGRGDDEVGKEIDCGGATFWIK